MKERIFYMHTKTDKVLIKAKNRDEAFAKFFKDVEDGKIGLDTLGNIVILFDRREEYPFRTVPLLWQMKLIDASTAVSNIMACTGVNKKEAEEMLGEYGFKDSRLIPLINKLRRREGN
jgi:hypothetical protein